jgi:hypothetical protein
MKLYRKGPLLASAHAARPATKHDNPATFPLDPLDNPIHDWESVIAASSMDARLAMKHIGESCNRFSSICNNFLMKGHHEQKSS